MKYFNKMLEFCFDSMYHFLRNEENTLSKMIRVDEEVLAVIKKHAEPLEDTPNSVLRRLLKIEKKSSEKKLTLNKVLR